MPGRFLTDADYIRLTTFPPDLLEEDVYTFYTLSSDDRLLTQTHRGAANQLGFALQLGTMRFLGFCPDDLQRAPTAVVQYLARQLALPSASLAQYGQRAQTRTAHLQEIYAYIQFRIATPADLTALETWLVHRALEHDKPSLLLQLAAEKLYRDHIVRPGITRLERMVVAARTAAHHETLWRMAAILTDARKDALDALLTVDAPRTTTRVTWLRQSMTTNSPTAILTTLDKIEYLRHLAVEQWDMSAITPNRLHWLAQQGRTATNQALQRMPADRRYPILVALLVQVYHDLIDEAITLFDRCLTGVMARSRRDRDQRHQASSGEVLQMLDQFVTMSDVILDDAVGDPQVRASIHAQIPQAALAQSRAQCAQLLRDLDTTYLVFVRGRYGYVRQFAPRLLATIHFSAHRDPHPVLEALRLLRRLNAQDKRAVPSDAPITFVPVAWLPYVREPDGTINRRFYELCALWELRNGLRSGDIWVAQGRRYIDPERYLIPRPQWETMRDEVCAMIGVPVDGNERVQQRKAELDALLAECDRCFATTTTFRIKEGKLHPTHLDAEAEPASLHWLKDQMRRRLPMCEITEVCIEIDRLVQFTRHCTHAGTGAPLPTAMKPYLYAAILAQACNLSLRAMARMADLSYEHLYWVTAWYLREETLQAALSDVANYQYHQSLSRLWGSGTLSSSDGQRFPVSVKASNASALPRYYGYGRGLTHYTWTADVHAQYGVRVISSTVRDATYVHDAIRDNATELPIVEHTTDTHGFTYAVFAIFDLDGLRFSPRLRDIADQTLYRVDRTHRYSHIESVLTGFVNLDPIVEDWDELLRIIGSIRLGWVSTSLLLSKWQAAAQQSTLLKRLQDYGRLLKTISILRYLLQEEYQRKIHRQLNKGENLHALRQHLFYANEGKIRAKHPEEQVNQAACLVLVTNAVVTWNTRYMERVIEQLRAEGHQVSDADIARLSPTRYEHINVYGKYTFDVDTWLNQETLRPLRTPD